MSVVMSVVKNVGDHKCRWSQMSSVVIMNRSRCKNMYLKNKTVENWEGYRKLRNECVKLTRKVKTEYFKTIIYNLIIDNNKLWKTIKPKVTNKIKKSSYCKMERLFLKTQKLLKYLMTIL